MSNPTHLAILSMLMLSCTVDASSFQGGLRDGGTAGEDGLDVNPAGSDADAYASSSTDAKPDALAMAGTSAGTNASTDATTASQTSTGINTGPGSSTGASTTSNSNTTTQTQAIHQTSTQPQVSSSVVATSTGTSTSVPCPYISGGNTGNFGTTGPFCFVTCDEISVWGCSNDDGRTVGVNGTVVSCGSMPLPTADGRYQFEVTAGTYTYASIYWSGTSQACGSSSSSSTSTITASSPSPTNSSISTYTSTLTSTATCTALIGQFTAIPGHILSPIDAAWMTEIENSNGKCGSAANNPPCSSNNPSSPTYYPTYYLCPTGSPSDQYLDQGYCGDSCDTCYTCD